MKRKTVNMILALGVLAVLGGVYFGVQKYTESQEKAEEKSEEETESVISVAADDLSSVKFMIDKKEVTFEKKDGNWIKSDEPDFPVDQDKLTEAFGTLNDVTADRVLDDVENIEEYGLDVPVNTITVETTDGTTTVLKIGMENESTNQYYLEKDDDAKTVYVVAGSIMEPFEKKLYDYAKMGSFPTVDSSTVQKVEVTKAEEKPYTLTKDADTGLWSVEGENGENKADTSKVNEIASALSSVSYDSLVDYHCEDLSEYGLNQPYAELTVDYQEQKATEDSDNTDNTVDDNADDTDEDETAETEPEMVDRTLILQIGDETEEDSRFVRVNDGKEIYTVSNDTIASLADKTETDFWDMTVNYVAANTLDSLELDYKNVKHLINVSRETSTDEDGKETETTTYQLDETEIDNSAFSKVYNKLINLIGQKRLTEEYTAPKDAELKAVYTDVDGKKSDVMFYPYDTNFYAVVADEKVYLVNKMTIKELTEALDELLGTEEENSAAATDQDK